MFPGMGLLPSPWGAGHPPLCTHVLARVSPQAACWLFGEEAGLGQQRSVSPLVPSRSQRPPCSSEPAWPHATERSFSCRFILDEAGTPGAASMVLAPGRHFSGLHLGLMSGRAPMTNRTGSLDCYTFAGSGCKGQAPCSFILAGSMGKFPLSLSIWVPSNRLIFSLWTLWVMMSSFSVLAARKLRGNVFPFILVKSRRLQGMHGANAYTSGFIYSFLISPSLIPHLHAVYWLKNVNYFTFLGLRHIWIQNLSL